MKCPLKFNLPEPQQACDPACAWFIASKTCCAMFSLAMTLCTPPKNPFNQT